MSTGKIPYRCGRHKALPAGGFQDCAEDIFTLLIQYFWDRHGWLTRAKHLPDSHSRWEAFLAGHGINEKHSALDGVPKMWILLLRQSAIFNKWSKGRKLEFKIKLPENYVKRETSLLFKKKMLEMFIDKRNEDHEYIYVLLVNFQNNIVEIQQIWRRWRWRWWWWWVFNNTIVILERVRKTGSGWRPIVKNPDVLDLNRIWTQSLLHRLA